MKKHISWPSIEQYRNVVKHVQHRASYVGMDDNGDAIYDKSRQSPTLVFEGTVKLHGTNASVCRSDTGEMWVQSRENIITPQKDNAGFAMFVEANTEFFENIFDNVDFVCHTSVEKTIVVFGEWCGKGIQRGVAISELPKMFVVFGIALVDAEGVKTYLTKMQIENVIDTRVAFAVYDLPNLPEDFERIFSIYDFPTLNMVIDFENPHESQNNLNLLTSLVEAECPVGKAFGVSGIGEGIVWRCISPGYEDSGYWFKVKGEKHSNSKVKTLATVDVERINNIKELAERLANNGRLEQMHQSLFDTLNGGETDIKKLGDFIKVVMQDIFKEDVDVIAASGFTSKEISGPVSKICRDFIMKKLEV